MKAITKKASEHLEAHGHTLSVDDFFAFAKGAGMKYITNATMYTENGTEMKTSLDKKVNKKWKELSKKWKSSK